MVYGCMIYNMKWARTKLLKSSLKCLESVVDHGYIFEDINNILTKNIIRGLFWKLEHIPFYIVQWT